MENKYIWSKKEQQWHQQSMIADFIIIIFIFLNCQKWNLFCNCYRINLWIKSQEVET